MRIGYNVLQKNIKNGSKKDFQKLEKYERLGKILLGRAPFGSQTHVSSENC